MRIGIIGYRNYTNYDEFIKLLSDVFSEFTENIDLIISGGARGTDKMAEKYAAEHKIPIKIFLPQWSLYGKSAGPIRNKLIVENSDIIIAFYHKNSKGTLHTVELAKKMGKDIFVFTIDTADF